MRISDTHANKRIEAPTLPSPRLPTNGNKPVAKTENRIPLRTSPELKSNAVTPGCTPKSLRALPNQLNSE
jgi:hypothetical protein